MSSSSSSAAGMPSHSSDLSSVKQTRPSHKKRSRTAVKWRGQRKLSGTGRKCRKIAANSTSSTQDQNRQCGQREPYRPPNEAAKTTDEGLVCKPSEFSASDAKPAESGNASNGSTLTGLPGYLLAEKTDCTHCLGHRQSPSVEAVDETTCSARLSSIGTPDVSKEASSRERSAEDESSSDEVCSPNKELITKRTRKQRARILVRFVVRSYRRFEHNSNGLDCKSVSTEEANRDSANEVMKGLLQA